MATTSALAGIILYPSSIAVPISPFGAMGREPTYFIQTQTMPPFGISKQEPPCFKATAFLINKIKIKHRDLNLT